MADSFSLGVNPTTGHFDHHSEFILRVTKSESVVDYPLPRCPVKELVHGLSVNQYRTTVVNVQTHTSDGSLSLTSSVIIGLVCFSLYQGESILRPLTLVALRIRSLELRGDGLGLYRP